MVGVFVKKTTRLLISIIQEYCYESRAQSMPILNIGITTHFREVKHVDFLSITQIRNPMGPGK